jgi:hypothetical protein
MDLSPELQKEINSAIASRDDWISLWEIMPVTLQDHWSFALYLNYLEDNGYIARVYRIFHKNKFLPEEYKEMDEIVNVPEDSNLFVGYRRKKDLPESAVIYYEDQIDKLAMSIEEHKKKKEG